MSVPELIVGFVLGIIVNLITDPVKRTIQLRRERLSRSFANKNLKYLQAEYERIKRLRNEPYFFYATFAGQTLHALSSLFLIVLILSLSFVLAILVSVQLNLGLYLYAFVAAIGVLFGYAGFRTVSESTLDIYRVTNFDTYEPEIRKRIEELKKQLGIGQP
ncbi:MAG: hypothetical protein RMK84_04115 [Oscillochloridaceae bacterium]|nr:hypothetical protein [Chloroflexaceae bacterium]MDW8389290.1 hypothetical protein [Oscillochloridaceae bacterium]